MKRFNHHASDAELGKADRSLYYVQATPAPTFDRELRKRVLTRVALLITPAALLCVAQLNAQGNPRDFGRPGPAQEMQKYFAQVQKEVYETVLLRWRNAASADDMVNLAKLYAEKGSYFPPGQAMIQTRNAIRDYFSAFLRDIGTLNVGLVDFGTSGDLAYVTARVSYQVAGADGQSRPITQTDLMVVRRASSGAWQIQTHLAREELNVKAED